ncbi:MAG: ferrous iron transport protein B, partial [Oscillospiraceae bacterium]
MAKKIALIGNPNCGKTTLFNALTGSNQYVGNWAGVTVEKKTGFTENRSFEIVDLPGIYSLSPYSMEEKVTKSFLIDENPDAIINIIDGTNIERNLYLSVQLIELGKPMVLVINMMDDVLARGDSVDCDYISKLLGLAVVPISARKSENIGAVLEKVDEVISNKIIPPEINYDSKTQNALNDIFAIIVKNCLTNKIPYSFYAAKLLEGDKETAKDLTLSEEQLEKVEKVVSEYEKTSDYHDREAMLADARYRFIEELSAKTVVKNPKNDLPTISDKIDRIVTNKWLALPIFLGIMLLMFSLTFGPVGTFLSDLIDKLINGVLTPSVTHLLDLANAPEWTYKLLIGAVITGAGGILTFLPQIGILFLFLSILEDSGYMARAAFITDRFLRKLGLSGKSFIPMIMGFGCTTPAVMATRTEENINERRMTIMMVPFMSCGAKI